MFVAVALAVITSSTTPLITGVTFSKVKFPSLSVRSAAVMPKSAKPAITAL